MIEILDRNRKKVAVLENAFEIVEDLRINAISYLEFSLPFDDPKNRFCEPFCYASFGEGLYRILPSALDLADTGKIHYTCEHVIATLIDNVLHGYHVVGNLGVYTKDCLQYVLSHQLTQNWVLGDCDFSRQFEYGWENETLLSALWSIPNDFSDDYIWTFDTSVYPWVVNLKRLRMDALPSLYLWNRKNLLSLQYQSDPTSLCTRLYPYGYGEGINQLTIESVNGGVPYLESSPEIVAKYGIIERVWIDRRYENAQSLHDAAAAMLRELEEPYVSYTLSMAELGDEERTAAFDKAAIGKIVQITDGDTGLMLRSVVTGIRRTYDNIRETVLTLANKPQDIASTVAEMADRQRIEQAYAQGATQLYALALQGNAEKTAGLVLNYFIPSEMRIINKILLKVRLESFRAYSKTTESGGGSSQTSSSGGGTSSSTQSNATQSETSGPSSKSTTNSGGQTTSGGTTRVLYSSFGTTEPNQSSFPGHTHSVRVSLIDHSHSIGSHSHGMDHTHTFSLPAHSHNFNVPAHSHSVTIPTHSHQIVAGIFRFGSPSAFDLYVGGKLAGHFDQTSGELDLTPYLVAADGKITRGIWQSVEIRPNDLAYISADMIVQGFVQSRGDYSV